MLPGVQKVSMKECSSLRIGGEGEMIIADTEEKVKEVYKYAELHNLRVVVLGEGTNSFFKDVLGGILFLKMGIKGVDVKEYDDHVILQIGGGETFDTVIDFAVTQGWWGVENLSYIPGTAGAAPVQNIGAYGAELKNTLVTVRAYDTHTHDYVTLSNDECKFGYRSSLFKEEKGRYCITAITLRLSRIPQPILNYKPLDSIDGKENVSLQDIRDLVIRTRQEKLPDYHTHPNTGSFFKNPIVTKEKGDELREKYANIPLHESDGGYKISAAWLIEHIAEMKGVRVGDVGTWPKQPLVIVNYGKATYEDLMLFTGMITQKIQEKVGIYLEREVNYVE